MPPISRSYSRSAGWLIALSIVTAAGSFVTAGVLTGASIAFAIQALRRGGRWVAMTALCLAAISVGLWIAAWWQYATAGSAAMGNHPARAAAEVLLTACVVGTICWVVVGSISRRMSPNVGR
jgi:hypothetical protein